MAKGKKNLDAVKSFDRLRLHGDADAVGLVKSLATRRFDESVDVVVRLGVDPRKADQMLRGTVSLPSGTGKEVRIAVFAQGEAATAARDAGADLVGAEDLAEQVTGGMTDFDVAIATPDMMPVVGKLGRILGPRGLMPNPKTGTVTNDVARTIDEFKGAGWSTARTGSPTSMFPSAESPSRRPTCSRTCGPWWPSFSGPSRPRPRQVRAEGGPELVDGAWRPH